MQCAARPGRKIVRPPVPPQAVALAAHVVLDDRFPLPALLVDFSRHGFRVTLPRSFAAAQRIRLEVPGWPRLVARVIWSQGGRTACLFEPPPVPRIFATMCAALAARAAADET